MLASLSLAEQKERFERLLQDANKTAASLSGCSKFTNIIRAELKQLEKARLAGRESSGGSNYFYLFSILEVLKNVVMNVPYPTDKPKLFKLFGLKSNSASIRIDISTGPLWIKIKSKGRYDFQEEDDPSEEEEEEEHSEDESESSDSGVTDRPTSLLLPPPKIIKHTQTLLAAAANHPYHFKPPKIIYQFVRLKDGDLSRDLVLQLQSMDVRVNYGMEGLTSDVLSSLSSSSSSSASDSLLHLDIPILIAMASCITNNFHEISFKAFENSAPLLLQYQDELKTPMLPQLQNFLKEKILLTTYSAFLKFKPIIETIGGSLEQARALYFFDTSGIEKPLGFKIMDSKEIHLNLNPPIKGNEERLGKAYLEWKVFVVENSPSAYMVNLGISSMTETNQDIFGTADAHQTPLLTCNGKLQRAIDKAGRRDHPIISIQPRGLIEQKWMKELA